MKTPLITVTIPVFHTEPYLQRCLESVALQLQTFTDFEVVVVNDEGRDFKSPYKNYKKIIKAFKKAYKIPLTYIEHNHNLGLVEVRRDSVQAAKGKYICILDSDDTLPSGALLALYSATQNEAADLVFGRHCSGEWKENQFIPNNLKKDTQVFPQKILREELFYKWLIEKSLSGILWAKLIRRETYLEALNQIPYTLCNVAEDVVQFFFICLYAKNCSYLDKQVYNYTVTTGMTSNKMIDNIKNWEMVCSTASVFSIIFLWLQENGYCNSDGTITENQTQNHLITPQIIEALKTLNSHYVANNLTQLKHAVVPELQQQAYELLCDYWGKDYVETIKRVISQEKSTSETSKS